MMLLYEHPLSSYVQKVTIALREKDIAFTVERPTGVGSGAADGPFLDGNLCAEVPLLVDGGVCIFDSTIILEYLEDKVPTPRLLPPGAAGRARARMIDHCATRATRRSTGASGRSKGSVGPRAPRRTIFVPQWLHIRAEPARCHATEARQPVEDAPCRPSL
jgi:glutathione S-transferase